MYLVIGLGNPGARYSHNRHNAGFMLVDRLAEQAGTRFERILKRSLTCTIVSEGHTVLLAKPQTFMNLSGAAVAELLHRFPFDLERSLVAYDDVALPVGKVRLRRSGTSGGHRGMQAIIEVLNSLDIPRLRLGVGESEPPRDYPDYVLSDFSREQWPSFESAVDRACLAIQSWISEGIEKAMSKFNC